MAQFPLLMNGVEVCTLEDLKKNFNPEDLVAYRKRFAAWLKGWDYDEEAVEVKSLDPELTDEQWLDEICKIVDCVDVWQGMKQTFNNKKKKAQAEEFINEVKQLDTPEKQEKLLSEISIEISPEKHTLPKGEKHSFFATSSAFIVKSGNKCFLSKDGNEYDNISSDFVACEWISCVNNLFVKCTKKQIQFSNNGFDWKLIEIKHILNIVNQRDIIIDNIFYANNKYIVVWRKKKTDYYRFSISDNLQGGWKEAGYIKEPVEKISFYNDFYFVQSGNQTFYSDNFEDWDGIWDDYRRIASYLKKNLPPGVELKKIDEHYYQLVENYNQLTIPVLEKNITIYWNGSDIFVNNTDNSQKINLASVPFSIRNIFYTNSKLWITSENGELFACNTTVMGIPIEKLQEKQEEKKFETKKKKKIVPTPENIQVTINNKKSPFCDPVTDVFVCEKGVMINTKSDQLYLSKDGEYFTPIVPNNRSYHYYRKFSYLNGYFVFQDSDTIYFSQDGREWDSFELDDILPAGSKDYDSPNYKSLPSIENIVYNNNRKSFTIFYSFYRDVGVGNDITKIYCMSTASKLDGSWTDWGEINSFPFLEPRKFYWTQGKYFTSVSWGQEKYGYNAKYDNGVYFSEDGLIWTQAEESDKNWLDGLEVEDSNIWMHIDYCNCKDGQMRYFLEEAKIIPWGEIYFSHGDDTIKAWKEDFERQPVSEECDFTIKTVVCFNDKLLIFGENNEFALGEIQVK
ncbi:MAG: hypothetical protein IJV89_08160 [Lentisphaeria bacterium]|nr:hypothetical protein [Lentisphaeria bacterium]